MTPCSTCAASQDGHPECAASKYSKGMANRAWSQSGRFAFLSVLEEAESPALLRWTYDGMVGGWGQCVIRQHGESALSVFQTELWATEPHLKKLMRMWPAREAASTHLKRCLAQLGRMVSGDGSQVRVGPAARIGQSIIPSEQPRCLAYASESSRFRETL